MALILVEHRTAAPALYGALAAVVAAERGAGLAHLPARFDVGLHPDAVQHVAASGVLVPSGLLWFERLTGRDVGGAATVEAVLRDATRAHVVVPLHPAVMPDGLAEALRDAAEAAGVTVERLAVVSDGSRFALRRVDAEGPRDLPGRWIRDGFGRFVSSTSEARTIDDPGPPLRVGLIGAERQHRDVYPGAIAALGDAADAAGLAIDVMFIDPRGVRASEVPALLAGVDGVLLPGGSDMADVSGQVLMARGALDGAVPAVGLCLGMQTMTTAIAQKALGDTGVDLAEADPDAPLHSFVALAETPGLPPHRLGEHPTAAVAGTDYGDLPGTPSRERFNHRYRVNPLLEPVLVTAGMRISARDGTGTIIDAIEVGAHPFFIGLQGHPELRSHPRSPHPVLSAFVQAIRRTVGLAAPAASSRWRRRPG